MMNGAGAVDNGQRSNYYFKVVVVVLLDYSGVITKSLNKHGCGITNHQFSVIDYM